MIEQKLLRLPAVVEMTGLSKTTIWRYEKKGLFPKRISVTARTVAWLAVDIEAFIGGLK